MQDIPQQTSRLDAGHRQSRQSIMPGMLPLQHHRGEMRRSSVAGGRLSALNVQGQSTRPGTRPSTMAGLTLPRLGVSAWLADSQMGLAARQDQGDPQGSPCCPCTAPAAVQSQRRVPDGGVCELLLRSTVVRRDATLQLLPATVCTCGAHNLCGPKTPRRHPLQSSLLPVDCVHANCLIPPVQGLSPPDTSSSVPDQPRRGSAWQAARNGWQLAAASQQAGEAAAWDSQTSPGEPRVVRIGPHDFCGEEALIDGPVQRLSTVTALTDCELATISKVQRFGPALHDRSTCVV